MSRRELKALGSQILPGASKTRSTHRTTTQQTTVETTLEASDVEMEELKAQVERLQRDLKEAQTAIEEAQNAIEAKDEELSRVSAECERVSSEARAVLDLASTLRDVVGTGPTGLSTFFTSFLESQSKLLAAQSNALAVQNAPPLVCFTGENVEAEESSFVSWLEQFEERATLLSWSDEQKSYQLKSHLSKTALQVFKLLTPAQRASYTETVAALRDRFKPVDIEELRGLEFHQLTQTDESVEQLGLRLMTLAKKAFPSLATGELDRLLKGRFFQALLPKWQRKLGAPKVTESFSELYERARTSERHDQQYRTNPRGKDVAKPKGKTPESSSSTVNPAESESSTPPHPKRHSTIKCYFCGEMGHFKRNCPSRVDKSEAVGKSSDSLQPTQVGISQQSGSTAAVGVAGETQAATPQQQDLLKSLSDQQLEGILAARHCSKEQKLLKSDQINVSTVTADGTTPALGATLELDVTIEGVQVCAMVDTGAESSIISRETLHKIGSHLKTLGKPMPTLQPASAKLYGKDGKPGGHVLNITAQVTFTVAADGVSVPVILFIQPDSRQPCLLGMNAAPALQLSFLNARGEPLRRSVAKADCNCPRVSLIQTKAVPARAQSFVEAEVESELLKGACVLFEPDKTLETHGIGAPESLLHVSDQGKVFIPIVNYQQQVVHLDGGTSLGLAEVVPADRIGVDASSGDVAGGSGGSVNDFVGIGQVCGGQLWLGVLRNVLMVGQQLESKGVTV